MSYYFHIVVRDGIRDAGATLEMTWKLDYSDRDYLGNMTTCVVSDMSPHGDHRNSISMIVTLQPHFSPMT